MARRYVLLGDVVSSRSIENRETFQTRLAEACKHVNRTFRAEIFAEFALLKGIDEFGGVLSSLSNLYGIVREFAERLHPIEARFALVYDEIDVATDSRDVAQMDGPAFHLATSLLEELKDTSLRFEARLADPLFNSLLANEINLLLLHRRSWSERQREIVYAYRRHGNQSAVADRLGISQQAVSDSLTRASWPLLQTVEERLETALEHWEDRSKDVRDEQ